MARKMIDVIELGDLTGSQFTSGTISVVSSPARTGGYSLRSNPVGSATGFAQFGGFNADGSLSNGSNGVNVSTAYYRFYFRYAVLPASGNEDICLILDTGNSQVCTLRLNSTGTISLYDRSSVLKATGGTSLGVDTWYRVEFKVGLEPTGSNDGPYELRVDGGTEFSGNDLDSTSNNMGGIRLGKNNDRGSNSVDFFYDDLAIDDSSFPGAGAVRAMQPDSAGTYSGATSGTYADVDELPSDGDTTYMSWLNNASRHSANLASSSTSGISGTIACVQPYGIGRAPSGGTASMRIFIRSGTTDTDSGGGVAVTNSYQFFGGSVFSTDPSDAGAWTTTKLDSLQVGNYMDQSSGAERRLTVMGVMVEFQAAAAVRRWFLGAHGS